MPLVRSLIRMFRKISNFLRPMQIPLHSAYTCFFLILSLFPGLLLLLGILRYTAIDVKDLMKLLENWLPQSLLPTVQSLVEASYRHSSGALVSVSVAAALYSASRGMFGIRNGLDAIHPPQHHRSYWRKRGISILYNTSFLLVLILTLLLYLLSSAFLDYLSMTTVPSMLFLLRLVDFRLLLLLVLQIAVFTMMYALLPDHRNRLRESLPGATISSVGWLVFSKLFSVYVEHFTDYANIYGSIYALALGMLWLYFCISIFFYGGALNRFLQQRPTHQ